MKKQILVPVLLIVLGIFIVGKYKKSNAPVGYGFIFLGFGLLAYFSKALLLQTYQKFIQEEVKKEFVEPKRSNQKPGKKKQHQQKDQKPSPHELRLAKQERPKPAEREEPSSESASEPEDPSESEKKGESVSSSPEPIQTPPQAPASSKQAKEQKTSKALKSTPELPIPQPQKEQPKQQGKQPQAKSQPSQQQSQQQQTHSPPLQPQQPKQAPQQQAHAQQPSKPQQQPQKTTLSTTQNQANQGQQKAKKKEQKALPQPDQKVEESDEDEWIQIDNRKKKSAAPKVEPQKPISNPAPEQPKPAAPSLKEATGAQPKAKEQKQSQDAQQAKILPTNKAPSAAKATTSAKQQQIDRELAAKREKEAKKEEKRKRDELEAKEFEESGWTTVAHRQVQKEKEKSVNDELEEKPEKKKKMKGKLTIEEYEQLRQEAKEREEAYRLRKEIIEEQHRLRTISKISQYVPKQPIQSQYLPALPPVKLNEAVFEPKQYTREDLDKIIQEEMANKTKHYSIQDIMNQKFLLPEAPRLELKVPIPVKQIPSVHQQEQFVEIKHVVHSHPNEHKEKENVLFTEPPFTIKVNKDKSKPFFDTPASDWPENTTGRDLFGRARRQKPQKRPQNQEYQPRSGQERNQGRQNKQEVNQDIDQAQGSAQAAQEQGSKQQQPQKQQASSQATQNGRQQEQRGANEPKGAPFKPKYEQKQQQIQEQPEREPQEQKGRQNSSKKDDKPQQQSLYEEKQKKPILNSNKQGNPESSQKKEEQVSQNAPKQEQELSQKGSQQRESETRQSQKKQEVSSQSPQAAPQQAQPKQKQSTQGQEANQASPYVPKDQLKQANDANLVSGGFSPAEQTSPYVAKSNQQQSQFPNILPDLANETSPIVPNNLKVESAIEGEPTWNENLDQNCSFFLEQPKPSKLPGYLDMTMTSRQKLIKRQIDVKYVQDEQGQQLVDVETMLQILDCSTEVVAEDYIEYVTRQRVRRREAKKSKQYSDYLDFIYELMETQLHILDKGFSYIASSLDIDPEVFQHSMVYYTDHQEHGQEFIERMTFIQQSIKEIMPCNHQIRKQQGIELIKFQREILHNYQSYDIFTFVMQRYENLGEERSALPAVLNCVIDDIIYDKYKYEEEDKIKFMKIYQRDKEVEELKKEIHELIEVLFDVDI